MIEPASEAYPRNPAAKKPFGGTENCELWCTGVKPALGSHLALFANYEYDTFITDREPPELDRAPFPALPGATGRGRRPGAIGTSRHTVY